MEVGIKDVAYNALSLLVVSGILTEEDFNEATNSKRKGYDDLFNLLEEKYKEFSKAHNDNQK